MFHQNSLKFLGVSLYIILKTNEGLCNLTVHSRKIQCTYFVHNIVFFAWVKLKLFGPSTQTTPWSYSLAAIISHTFIWKDNCHGQFTKQNRLCMTKKTQYSFTDRMQMVPCMADI